MVWTRTAALALALVLCTGGVGLLLWLRASLPRLDGRLALPGLHGTVTVARDAFGIPRISAGDEHDGYFALGFVHAQDRLWQMEAQRRVGAGRLAELVGEPGLPSDRFMRTLGLYRLAEATYRDLDPPVRAAIDAYGEGVNAWLSTRDRPLPPEFQLLGATPEAWRPADTLVWGKLMALQLAGNWRDELLRARLAARLPPERMRVLWPEGAAAEGPTIQGLGDTAGALLAGLPEVVMPRLASNIWVVSGALSETGKPILANDPHLALQAPILWYLATLSVPGLEVSGATVPGVPFHLMGHNRGMAWGFTTTSSDTMDLFIERLEGADAYLTPDGPQPLETRPETIRVKDRPDVVITVRTTRHGPLVTDALTQPPPLPMALAAAALAPGDRTVQAMWKLNRATGWDEFVAAMADFHAPQQNVAMAAIDGTIGIYSPGRVPIRRQGDGTVPRPGWTGEFDWTGWIPFDQLPHARDPAWAG